VGRRFVAPWKPKDVKIEETHRISDGNITTTERIVKPSNRFGELSQDIAGLDVGGLQPFSPAADVAAATDKKSWMILGRCLRG
jgi:hypothetical protein